MRKRVNVEPTIGPIYTLSVPITGKILNHEMSVGDILNCIYARARVDEILPSGKLVRLNLTNYDKDNTIKDALGELKDENGNKVELPTVSVKDSTPKPIKPLEEPKEEVVKEEPKEEIVEPKEELVKEEPKEEVIKEEPKEEIVEEPKMNNKNNEKRNK